MKIESKFDIGQEAWFVGPDHVPEVLCEFCRGKQDIRVSRKKKKWRVRCPVCDGAGYIRTCVVSVCGPYHIDEISTRRVRGGPGGRYRTEVSYWLMGCLRDQSELYSTHKSAVRAANRQNKKAKQAKANESSQTI